MLSDDGPGRTLWATYIQNSSSSDGNGDWPFIVSTLKISPFTSQCSLVIIRIDIYPFKSFLSISYYLLIS